MAISFGDQRPANPAPYDVWYSSALEHARFPAHPGETRVAIDGGSSGQPVQEPNGWFFDNVVYLMVNISGVTNLYTATAPKSGRMDDVRFVLRGQPIGGGTVHPSLFIEGENLYLISIPSTPSTVVEMRTNTMSAIAANPLAAWSAPVTLISKGGSVLPNLTQLGNFSMAKLGEVYHLLIEGLWAGGGESWQAVIATSPTVAGPYTLQSGTLSTLDPFFIHQRSFQFPIPAPTNFLLEGYRGWGSTGPIFFENGHYVMISHGWRTASGDPNPASDIFKYTSPDLREWKCDLWGYPTHGRADSRWELDQAADPVPVKMPGGWWCFWTGACNPGNFFVVKWAPLSPTALMWDGFLWVPMDQNNPIIGSPPIVGVGRHAIAGTPVLPFTDIPVDPGSTVGFVVTLPRGFYGATVGIMNSGTNAAGTVQVACVSPDIFASTQTQSDATTIARGQAVLYKCLKGPGGGATWNRVG